MKKKVKLGELFEIGSGGTPSKKHPEYYGGDVPWVKTGDLKSEYLYEVEDYITDAGLKNSSAKMYEPETVLIAMYGATIGATSIVKFPACTNQACAAFKPNHLVRPEYLYYFLTSRKQQFIKDGVGGAQPNISASYLKKVEFNLIDDQEQDEIIRVLNRVSSVIRSRKLEIEKLDELIKARFVEMSNSWHCKEKQLSEYIESITYGFTNPMPDAEEGPWKITAKDVNDGHVNCDTARKTTKEAFAELTNKSKPIIGDVLLTKDGTLGRTAVVESENICVNQSVAVLRCNDKVVSRFLSLLLQLPEYQREMTKNSSGGTIKHIYITKIDKMIVRIPRIDQQIEFIEFVKQVDRSKAAVQKSLDETQLLFDSLMQQYFA